MATDSHINGGAYEPVLEDASAYAAAFIPAVNAATKDAVIVLGDIVHRSEDVAQGGDFVGAIPYCYAAIGNHELYNAADPTAAKALAVNEYGMASNYYAFDLGICRIIVLDTNYDGDDNDASIYEAHIPAAQQAWLANELATTTQEAVLIFMHHPPQEYRPNGVTINFDAADLAELSAIVNSRENVWIFAGHWHQTHNFRFGETDVYVRSPLLAGKYTVIAVTKMQDGHIAVTFGETSLTL